MRQDGIVEEVRAIREAIAAEHDGDVTAIAEALQRRQGAVISLGPKRLSKDETARKAG